MSCFILGGGIRQNRNQKKSYLIKYKLFYLGGGIRQNRNQKKSYLIKKAKPRRDKFRGF